MPEPKEGDLQNKSGQTSQETPKTYSHDEHTKALEKARSDALAEAGRKYKPLEDENVIYKATVSNLNTRIADAEATLAELTSKDPEKADVKKLIDSLNEQKRKFTAQELTYGERIKKMEEAEFSVSATMIAAEFEQNDPEKLIRLCKRANATTEDAMREVAADMGWTKKPTTTQAPASSGTPPPPDGTGVSGGSTDDRLFVQKFGSGELPISKENLAKLKRIQESYN